MSTIATYNKSEGTTSAYCLRIIFSFHLSFLTTDDTDFPDKKASSLCHLCNSWFLSFKRECTIRRLSARDYQYLHFVSLSINQIEAEV